MVEPLDRSAAAYIQLRVDRLTELMDDSLLYVRSSQPSFWDRFMPWSNFRKETGRFRKIDNELSTWSLAQEHFLLGDGSLAADLIDQDATSLFEAVRQGYYGESLKAFPPSSSALLEIHVSETLYTSYLAVKSKQATSKAEADRGVLNLKQMAGRLRGQAVDPRGFDAEKGLTEARPLTT